MMKSVLLSLHIIGIVLFALSQKNEIKVSHDTPAAMSPGEEVEVSINLDKSDVMGFAKYQITVDEGLSIESIDAAGASFTFNNQTAKFIWMTLPNNRKIDIRIRLKSSNDALGNLEVKQRFSYIYNNERKNFDTQNHVIAVGKGEDLSAVQVKKSLADKAKNLEANVYSSRKVSSAGVNQWRVDVEIDKQNLQGFAKIEEKLPYGYTAIDLKSSGAIFSIDDSEIKYIWYDFPETDKVTISYKMLPVVAMDGKKPEASGTFSFLLDDESVVITIGDNYNTDEVAQAGEQDQVAEPEQTPEQKPAEQAEPKSAAQPGEPAAMAKQVQEKPKAAPPKPLKEELATKPKEAEPKVSPEPQPKTTTEKAYTDANIVNVPMPDKGVHYRVQIAAGKNNLQNAVFEKLYSFKEGFMLENHEGWIKYTTGSHQVYKAARNDRERIRDAYDKFKGPFVTAYNNGERITVQEALMVTSQKWVP